MPRRSCSFALLLVFITFLPLYFTSASLGQTPMVSSASSEDDDARISPHVLVEEFTADTLTQGEVKLGSEVEVGITNSLIIGTDVISGMVGAPSLQTKLKFFQRGSHKVAFGVRAAYLDKDTFLWGSADEHFDELNARIIRPSISWTHELSSRLKLHTFWAKGLGEINAELSEKGRRKLWETKHPGDDFESRDKATNAPSDETDDSIEGDDTSDQNDDDSGGDDDGVTSSKNQEKAASGKQSSLTQQSIQVQSIAGLAQDRFQLTGEYTRKGGNKVLVTSRIEQTVLEELKSNFFRLTAAHQWIWTSFQMRLGIGMQYFVMSGRDLDGEEIDEAGVQPASDISFYWRF